MAPIAPTILALIALIHAAIHLLGFAAYWPVAEIAQLPYKTRLLGGRWQVGPAGMRLYGGLWLLTALAIAAASFGLLRRQSWWLPMMGGAALLSLAMILLDWEVAYRGALFDLVILAVVAVGFGLRTPPEPFPPYTGEPPDFQAVPLPAGLAAPVDRFYQRTMGEEIPVVDSMVLSARGTIRLAGIPFPSRLRFTHEAGEAYRHYIETTIFGRPLIKVNEWYLDGEARLELPVGVVEGEPKVDSAANLGLWGESIWLPSIYLTDPRVTWEPIDATAARLLVPAGEGTEAFTVTFDPESGLIHSLEALRFKDAEAGTRTPWRFEVHEWGEFHGLRVPSAGAVRWLDEQEPWLVLAVDDVVYNVDVEDYIRAAGP